MEKKGVVVAAAILAVITVMSGAIATVLMGLRTNPSPNMSSPTMPLGVIAVVLALTTQILASTAVGCCGAWRQKVPSQTRRILAILLFIASWVLTIKVVLLFLVGSMLGFSECRRNTVANGNCTALGVWVFMAATILFLIVVCLDIASFILIQKGPIDSTTETVRLGKPPSGIAMGAFGAVKC